MTLLYPLALIGAVTVAFPIFLTARWFWKTRHWKGYPLLGGPWGPGPMNGH